MKETEQSFAIIRIAVALSLESSYHCRTLNYAHEVNGV